MTVRFGLYGPAPPPHSKWTLRSNEGSNLLLPYDIVRIALERCPRRGVRERALPTTKRFRQREDSGLLTSTRALANLRRLRLGSTLRGR